jgi:diguanylate cyclase (GGDEF)-like protein
VFIGFSLIGIIGAIDFLTGYELSFSVFYVIPIFLVTWFTGRTLGLITSIISAFVWFAADIVAAHPYSHALIPVWNSFIRLTFFVVITYLFSSLKSSTERERELSRKDYLTGAANSRSFYKLAQMEIDRFQRYAHPFSLAFIDLDNFKYVNDQFGHAVGDQVLRTVVSSVKKHSRKTDVIARLGGDEFALLLSETNEESARIVVTKIQDMLLEEMRENNWPITFSIGVLTCKASPDTTDELVRLTDELMYSVKKSSKNAIKYACYAG